MFGPEASDDEIVSELLKLRDEALAGAAEDDQETQTEDAAQKKAGKSPRNTE